MANYEQNNFAPDVLEAAAKWHVRLNSGDASDQDVERHMDWLLRDPAHADAYEHVAATLRDASQYEQAARAAFDSELSSEGAQASARKTGIFAGWAWPQWSVAATAAAVLLFTVLVPGTGLFQEPAQTQSYAAAGDTVQSYTLSDGSRVSLFAGSELTATIGQNQRSITLVSGRAFFDVTTDRSRPFQVAAGNKLVTVVGTRFEVVLGRDFDSVAVNEGLVSVGAAAAANGDIEPVLIEPGMVVTYAQQSFRPDIVQTSASSIGTWAEGVLSFNEAPLPDVITEIQALFPDKRLRLKGDGLQTMQFSGTLVVSDAEKMMQQLGMFLELTFEVIGDEIALKSR